MSDLTRLTDEELKDKYSEQFLRRQLAADELDGLGNHAASAEIQEAGELWQKVDDVVKQLMRELISRGLLNVITG